MFIFAALISIWPCSYTHIDIDPMAEASVPRTTRLLFRTNGFCCRLPRRLPKAACPSKVTTGLIRTVDNKTFRHVAGLAVPCAQTFRLGGIGCIQSSYHAIDLLTLFWYRVHEIHQCKSQKKRKETHSAGHAGQLVKISATGVLSPLQGRMPLRAAPWSHH